jgi:histidyl-tRNA synthetase
VGVSLGISRILGFMFSKNALKASRPSPTAVLVALNNDEERPRCYELASQLRARGIATEVFYAPHKFGKQIRYAEKKGIPFVLFAAEEGLQMKDIRSGNQEGVDLATWMPPAEDLTVQVVRVP